VTTVTTVTSVTALRVRRRQRAKIRHLVARAALRPNHLSTKIGQLTYLSSREIRHGDVCYQVAHRRCYAELESLSARAGFENPKVPTRDLSIVTE
jgi:hypothetical protein